MGHMPLIPTILCGGVGARLWPVSREQHPKPFIRLADGESLLQKSFIRGAKLPDVAEVLTVSNRELFFKTEDEYREINQVEIPTSFIMEPFGRNTAAAVAAAGLYVQEVFGADAQILILAADHLIADQEAFEGAVNDASILAARGQLVTFGIKPTAPEIGYGYIESEGSHVLRFVEKPTLERAEEYVASGRFLWNSGMFCFTAGTLLDAMSLHCSDILAAVRACLLVSRRANGEGFSEIQLDPETFAQVPDDSIDFALMEKAENVSVVPCDIGWSDIGSWTALGDLADKDSEGNRSKGQVFMHATRGCTITANDRVIGAVGLDDLIIVDTQDALLVASKGHAQDVKHIYNQLKADGNEACRSHRIVNRPWGTYTILEEGAGFKIKRIEVKAGGILSLQLHTKRCEHWVVVEGVAKVLNNDEEFVLNTNESTYISARHKHRLENLGPGPLVIIEVQTGGYLGEDDIVRFKDNYGRQCS